MEAKGERYWFITFWTLSCVSAAAAAVAAFAFAVCFVQHALDFWFFWLPLPSFWQLRWLKQGVKEVAWSFLASLLIVATEEVFLPYPFLTIVSLSRVCEEVEAHQKV